jgi:AraC family transcriptional regulator of adaptative response/methylated-DNA-[protein]-cysteine methyltransferase
VGVSPKAYLDARRRDRLKERLRMGEPVTRATYAAGFRSPNGPYRRRSATLGITPGAYRRGGVHLTITYGIVPCSMGRLLVARTDRGVCAVTLGDQDAQLEAALGAEFPAAQLSRDDAAVSPWATPIVRRVDGEDHHADVVLDLHGTAFQLRVWQALQQIPVGETRSYAELAAAIGRPSAVRAVARACATNRVAVVVPCHRVIAASGKPSGYRWGVERKRWLLERERA